MFTVLDLNFGAKIIYYFLRKFDRSCMNGAHTHTQHVDNVDSGCELKNKYVQSFEMLHCQAEILFNTVTRNVTENK